MNRSILKISLLITLLSASIFQVTFIMNNKKEEKATEMDMVLNEELELEKIKYPPLEDYIIKLNGYGHFTLGSIHTIDDYYEVRGKVVGDIDTIKNFFSYIDDVKDYNISDYLIHSSEGQYQLDVVLELPR
ncbi:hypothetical protein ACPWSR_17165 [Alloiococcus sp. CFN-8]|uniref:hypothetical protein n=1 Tax=Alloiococcus sp. CFN-8 TaxID=3416081 RepID=UPI003CE7AE0B